MDDLSALRATWDALGEEDAFRAILSARVKAGEVWDREAFFETGRRRARSAVASAELLQPGFGRDRALDFGCGVGRLTQGLCDHFARCDGVDIAPSMIRQAEELNRFGDRCRYRLNASENLELFDDDTFDFVLSILVLQHCRAASIQSYIAEFIRILKPRGVVVFQLTADIVPPGSLSRADEVEMEILSAPALQARIELRRALGAGADATPRLVSGTQRVITVEVQNTSAAAWSPLGDGEGRHQIKLRHRWLNEEGGLVSPEESATLLPDLVAPGAVLELPLLLSVPLAPGAYALEVGMGQEGARDAWAARAARCDVDVVSDPSAQARPEMHGIPRPRVVDLIGASGGRVLSVDAAGAAGPSWTSYRYSATKD